MEIFYFVFKSLNKEFSLKRANPASLQRYIFPRLIKEKIAGQANKSENDSSHLPRISFDSAFFGVQFGETVRHYVMQMSARGEIIIGR